MKDEQKMGTNMDTTIEPKKEPEVVPKQELELEPKQELKVVPNKELKVVPNKELKAELAAIQEPNAATKMQWQAKPHADTQPPMQMRMQAEKTGTKVAKAEAKARQSSNETRIRNDKAAHKENDCAAHIHVAHITK